VTAAPWFKCEPGPLLGEMASMPADMKVVYFTLLLRIFEDDGPVSDDAETLVYRTALPIKRTAAAIEWLIGKGKISRLSDGRLDIETTHAALADRTARFDGAKRAIAARYEKANKNSETGATPVARAKGDRDIDIDREEESSLRSDSISSLRSDSSPKAQSKPRQSAQAILEANGISASDAEALVAHRKAKRSPLTVRAAELLAKSLRDTGDPAAAIAMMIERGWTTCKREWFERERNRPNGQRRQGNLVEAGLELVEQCRSERDGVRARDGGDVSDHVVRLLSSR
jgi:hypothetical protein